MIGLQIGLSPLIGTSINLVMIAAAFIAINAPRNVALMGCFLLGFAHDLVGANSIGIYAVSYGLLAILVAGSDRAMSPNHPAVHFLSTLFGGIALAVVQWVHGKISHHGVPSPLWMGMMTAFYSAVFAVPVMWILTKIRRAFRFK